MTQPSEYHQCRFCGDYIYKDVGCWVSMKEDTNTCYARVKCPSAGHRPMDESPPTTTPKSEAEAELESKSLYDTGCAVCGAATMLYRQHDVHGTPQNDAATILLNDATVAHKQGRHTVMRLRNPKDPVGDGERKAQARPKKKVTIKTKKRESQ